jgi:hypothetical protein
MFRDAHMNDNEKAIDNEINNGNIKNPPLLKLSW